MAARRRNRRRPQHRHRHEIPQHRHRQGAHFATERTHPSFELALATDARDKTALACPSWWWDQVIDQRDRLVLPFGGGPPVTNTQTQTVQSQLHHSLHRLVERGQHEGSIRGDSTTCDVIIFGVISCC